MFNRLSATGPSIKLIVQYFCFIIRLIQASFYFGNILTQIPGGILAHKYGAKIVLFGSVFLSAIVVGSIPLAVTYGNAYGLIATRILIGFLQGPMLPCVAGFYIAWFPVEERGRNTSIVIMGINVGSFVSTYFAGVVISYTGRWDIVFYGFAVITGIVAILFALLCYETPQMHPYISEKEREFLKSKTEQYLEAKTENLPPTPWRAILTNAPVIALLSAAGIVCCANYIIVIGYSKYLNDVLHISVEKNSIYSSMSRIGNTFASIFSGFMSDWMYAKRNISLTYVRKICLTLASIISAICVLAASNGGCDELLVVTLLGIAISAQSFDTAGTIVNGLDLGPNYIKPLESLMYTTYGLAALLAPYIVGILTPNAYMSEWRHVFWLVFVLYIICGVIYTVWGSAKVQPWNSLKKSDQKA